MKKFITKTCFKFIFPLIIILAIVISWDPFRVFFSYDDYYTNNSITGNREDICLKLLNKRTNNISNFIIGSSRSNAFKTSYWGEKIKQPYNSIFHYDGSGFGLYRLTNAIKYLTQKQRINNVLLIVDTDFFAETSRPTGHLFIQHPSLTNESRFTYYFTFIKASIDAKFILYNLIYNITGKYYEFMGHHIARSKNSHVSINYTGDICYGYDKDIRQDSFSYYSNLIAKGVFYNRATYKKTSKPLLGYRQVNMLLEINRIVVKNRINLKIVISPLYNQIEFNSKDKLFLCNLFGSENVFDFSGKNKYTQEITNYYENSHYKPYVANQIIDSIYSISLNPKK